jgi:type IV pilus assembly protein PilV
MKAMRYRSQQGIMLIEAIIGLLIFLVGILAMLALQATAISVQSDAQYRIEAGHLTDRILGAINAGITRDTQGNVTPASLAAFQHQPAGAIDSCNYSGGASASSDVTDWVTAITTTPATRLPGSTASMQQILVNGNYNQVSITICWQGANDKKPRRHTVISYIN